MKTNQRKWTKRELLPNPVTMTTPAPAGTIEGVTYTTKIYMNITVEGEYIHRTKRTKGSYRQPFKQVYQAGGTTPMECSIEAVKKARESMSRMAATTREGKPWIVTEPQVTRITANPDEPAMIILRLPYTH